MNLMKQSINMILNQIDQLKRGPITAKQLKKKGIKSPEEENGIRLDSKTIVYPKKKFRSEASKQKWIEEKRKQLNLI